MDKNIALNKQALAQTLPATCFTRLDGSVSQLRSVRNRVSDLADALAGSTPEGTALGGEGVCSSDGRFDQIERAADDISGICDEIAGYLSRIERRL